MENEWIRIFDALPALVWTLLPDGFADFVNGRWLDYMGLSAEQVSGQGWKTVVHPDDLSTLMVAWHSIVASGNSGDLEVRMRHCDGDYRWFLFRMSPMTDASGRVVKWFGININAGENGDTKNAKPLDQFDLRRIMDGIPVPTAITTTSGEVRHINQPALNYFGKTLNELMGSKASDVVHPDDLPTIIEAQARAYKANTTYNVQSRHRRSDGVYRWFNVAGMPLRNEQGTISCWVHLLLDIDDQRRPDEALRSAERSLHSIIHTIPGLVWSARTDGWAEFFNQHYLDYVGLTAEQMDGWGWSAAVHPDDVQELTAFWKLILASREPGETEARFRRFDGVYRWFLCRLNPLRNDAGHIIKWYGINIDIDDRRRAEEKLRRNEAFLAQGQRISLTGSFSWCLDNDEVTFSEELYHIFGFEEGSIITQEKITQRVHPDDLSLVYERRIDARSTGGDHDYEIRLLMPNASVKHIHVVSHGTRNKYGQREYIGAIQDVTQRRASEETLGSLRAELARMAKINSLGALTASIAHEVNQPLSGVITNAGTCLRMLSANPPNIDGALETARRVIRDGHRASDVITRVRSLFSKKASATEWVNLNDATREVIALSQSTLKSNHVVLKTELSDDVPLITGDRVQLQQVILNLLLNAAEAMNGVDDRQRQVIIRTEREQSDHVRLTVQDSGIGFGSDGMSKLFETFYTTKGGGMGIGLSISQSIIERHHGLLGAAPNNGPGATFWFSIPRVSGEVEDETQEATPISSSNQTMSGTGSL